MTVQTFLQRFGLAALALLSASALAAGYLYYGHDRVAEHVDALQVLLREWGLVAVAAYVVVFMLLGAVGVPPALLIVPAVWAWPPLTALSACCVGGLGASVLGFQGSRHFVRDWVEPRIPPHLRQYEERLERRALLTVIILRLLFFLFPPVTWLLGLSHITLGTFVLGTALGALPGMLLFVLTGHGVVGWLLDLPPQQLGVIFAILAAGGAIWVWWGAYGRRRLKRGEAPNRKEAGGGESPSRETQ